MGRTTLLQRCARVHMDLKLAEVRVEELREQKRALAQELYERDGTGYVYDMGDGKPMILSKSRSGGYFFTPQNKWRAREEKKAGVKMKTRKSRNAQVVGERDGEPVTEGGPVEGVSTPGGGGEGGAPAIHIQVQEDAVDDFLDLVAACKEDRLREAREEAASAASLDMVSEGAPIPKGALQELVEITEEIGGYDRELENDEEEDPLVKALREMEL